MCKLIAKILLLILLFGQAFHLTPSIAYKPKVHKKITENAAIKSTGIESALEAIGLLPPGTELGEVKIKTESLLWWIQRGSGWEDNMLLVWGTGEDILYCHFHNPITGFGYTASDGEVRGQSLIARANDATNEWSYEMAKKLYYAALTGDNNEIVDSFTAMRAGFLGDVLSRQTNMSKEDRDQYFAWTLQALGHTLHLIQDASVPAHTRNDLHGLWEPLEKWTNKNRDDLLYDEEGLEPWTFWKQNLNINVPDVFIDADKLQNATTPPITGLDQGIAEYSHANFLSNDTVFSDGYPETISTLHDLDGIGMAHLGDVLFRENKQVGTKMRSFFYVKNETAQIDHFALCGIAWHIKQMEILTGNAPVTGIQYTVNDSEVSKDYAEKLIPRAVGYSAGLLDYFFRGSLEVSKCVPFIDENIIVSLNFKTKNVTATQETMSEGNFTVVVRYTPVGGNPDGSEDQFFRAEDVYCDELLYDNEIDFTVDLPLPGSEDSISFDVYESIKCYLVFKGTLGEEEGAVIGKVFTLGEIKFREDWDNGLNGNHDWAHGQSPTEPVEGGETINNITTANNQDTLIKENIRYAGVEDGRSNQSALSLGGGNEILITPNTFLHFKIDNFSVTPPSTIYLQALRIQFANGTWLQFCPDGQCDYPIDINWPPMDININIDSENALVTVNIHQLFQEAGIAIPEYLYLSYMNFIQLFEEGAGPATTQRMEIDFIRIVEETP